MIELRFLQDYLPYEYTAESAGIGSLYYWNVQGIAEIPPNIVYLWK